MTFGGTGHDVARSVLLSPDGGLVVAGDKDWCSEQGTDFWLVKLGGIPAEPEGGDALADRERVQTPGVPGFGAMVAVMGLLVCVSGREKIVMGVLSRIITILLALPLGIVVGNILGKVLIDAPLDIGFSLTGVILWLAIVLVFPAIASFYSGWKASRLTVKEVLVYE